MGGASQPLSKKPNPNNGNMRSVAIALQCFIGEISIGDWSHSFCGDYYFFHSGFRKRGGDALSLGAYAGWTVSRGRRRITFLRQNKYA